MFGGANLRARVGVLSIYRNGHPAKSADAFRLCLQRTLKVAAHETDHVLTVQHCTAFRCLMNGSNHLDESDARPLYPCPVCFRKLMWNLQVDAGTYRRRLAAFCAGHDLDAAEWYARAAERLDG